MKNLYNYLAIIYVIFLGIAFLVRSRSILSISCLVGSFIVLISQITLAIYLGHSIFGILCLGLTGVIVYRLIISRIIRRND